MKPIYFFIIVICVFGGRQKTWAQTWKTVRAERLYQEGLTGIKANQQIKAATALEEAVKLNPDHVDAQVQLARVYLNLRQYNKTISVAKLVIRTSPMYEDVYYYITGAYLAVNNPAEALRYTETALRYFPKKRDFAVKKLNILDLLKRFQDGDSWSQTLLQQYPADVVTRRSVAGHYEEKADWYAKGHLDDMAKTNYERALELAPNNRDLVDKLNNLVSQGGDLDAKIAKANAVLNRNGKSYQGLYYKLGLLQEAGRYAEALDVLHTLLRYYPNDKKALALNSTLRKDAATHYQNTEAYTLYQTILDENPNDKEALQKVTGMAMATNDYRQTLYRVDRALKRAPLDVDLLRQKMNLEYELHRYQTAADIAVDLYNGSKDKAFRSEIMQTINACGNYYLQQQLPDSALIYYNRSLLLETSNLAAMQGRVNSWVMKNNLSSALREIDKAIKFYPGNLDLHIRKSGFLAQSGKIREAVNLSEQLYKQNPANQNVRNMHLEQQLAASSDYIAAEEYSPAEDLLHALLKEEPDNKDALNYLSNILDLQKRYNEALQVVETGLKYYPADKDLLQKKASVLYNNRQFLASASQAAHLVKAYKYNEKYKQIAADAWLAASLDFKKKKLLDSAILSIDSAIAIRPADSTALLLKTNILMEKGELTKALAATDQALQKFEYAESFLLRKTIILDSLKRYHEAAAYADTIDKRYNSKKSSDYAALLRSKTFNNSFGLSLLNSSFSQTEAMNAPSAYKLATLDYSRIDTGKINYSGSLTFVGRQQGAGIMAEGVIAYKASKKLHWSAGLALSNNVILPKYRVSYSLFPTFASYEGEFGIRYFEVGGVHVLSAVTGLGKTFGPFDVNARLFGIVQKGNPYFAFTAVGRYDLSEQDQLQANFGLGSSPDDINRVITLNNARGIRTASVGAAYRRTFSYRISMGLSGSFTSQKIADALFYNQYDLQLSLRVKF